MIDERGLDVEIEVDGGIKLDNVAEVVAAGANVIVSARACSARRTTRATIAEMRARGEAARG